MADDERGGAWLQSLISPDALERFAKRDEEIDERHARERMHERMRVRRARIEAAMVPIPDEDVLAVSLLPETPLDEPPADRREEIERRVLATMRKRMLGDKPPFAEGPALVAVREVLRARARRRLTHPFIALLGSTGVHKTCSAAHAIASIADTSCYVKARALCDLQQSFHRDDRAELRRIYQAAVCVIDEVTLELAQKRRLGNALDELVDARQGARRITLFLGNVRARELAGMFDARSRSRMEGRVVWVQIAEKDSRTQQGG